MAAKYKIKLGSKNDTERRSIKDEYEKEERKILTVNRRSVTKAAGVASAVMRIAMAVFAIIGLVSILRPELRAILLEIAAEAASEIGGMF